MPRFIIHIGPHKTGTTYLQLNFRAVRAALRERGVLFPEFWEHAPGNPSHLQLTVALRDDNMADLLPRFAELRASGAATVLLSSEDLSNLEPPALERLRTLTGNDPVHIVFFVRRWSELMPSSWQEGIKQGGSAPLPQFMLMHMQYPEGSRLLNFDIKLSRFAELFGADSLKLVAYSELRERKIDIFQHFTANFLDWPDPPILSKLSRANASLAIKETELLRVVNALGRVDNVWRAFERIRGEFDLAPLFDAMEGHLASVRMNEHLPAMTRLHEALTEKYLPCTVPPKLPAKLFRPRNPQLGFVMPEYLMAPGVAALIGTIAEKLGVERATAK